MNSFMDFIKGTYDFPPRWLCGHWTKLHGWTHIISDLMVWSAYMAIPIILFYFVSKRKDLPFPKVIWLFGAFIAACGTVHLVEAIIFWIPIYRISAIIKLFTAIVSWATVIAMIPIVPFVLNLKSPKEFQREIDLRIQAEKQMIEHAQELQHKNEELKARQKKLESNTEQLDKMNRAMVGRETKMIELKKRIKELEAKFE